MTVCVCVCASRAPDEEDGGPFVGVQDSQEVCTTSFSTSPPSQVWGRPHLLFFTVSLSCLLFTSIPYFSFHFFSSLFVCFLSCFPSISVCVCPCACVRFAQRQCVCTLSPSPSKLSKPVPLDNVQLPLAPGLVTHTVSLYWPLRVRLRVRHLQLNEHCRPLRSLICFGLCVAPLCVQVS